MRVFRVSSGPSVVLQHAGSRLWGMTAHQNHRSLLHPSAVPAAYNTYFRSMPLNMLSQVVRRLPLSPHANQRYHGPDHFPSSTARTLGCPGAEIITKWEFVPENWTANRFNKWASAKTILWLSAILVSPFGRPLLIKAEPRCGGNLHCLCSLVQESAFKAGFSHTAFCFTSQHGFRGMT